MTGQRKIGVLMGGLSAERDVSMRSGEAIVAALADRGYDAWPLFVDRDVDLVLRQARIDVAFLALHGRYGEDGCIQGHARAARHPVHRLGRARLGAGDEQGARPRRSSGSTTCRRPPATWSRPTAARTCWSCTARSASRSSSSRAGEGSSLGTRVARDELELEAAVEDALRFDDDVLVERFIDGKEISVGGAGRQAARRRRDRPQARLLRLPQQVHGRPHRLPPARAPVARALSFGAAAGDAGARRAGLRRARRRVDLIVSERGNEVILEVNTLPGMTPTSLLPKIAHGAGLSFEDLVEEILNGRAAARPRPPARSTGRPGLVPGPRAPHRLPVRRALAAPAARRARSAALSGLPDQFTRL